MAEAPAAYRSEGVEPTDLVFTGLRERPTEPGTVRDCLTKMRSGRRGENELLALRQGGRKLIDDTISRCEEATTRLIAAHLNAGDRNPKMIAEHLQVFVDAALATVPGAGLYRSARAETASAARLLP